MPDKSTDRQATNLKFFTRLSRSITGATLLFDALDKRLITGITFIFMALVFVSGPVTGPADFLGSVGLSPRGYGYLLAFVGCLILRYPRSDLYSLFTMSFLPLVGGVIGYAFSGGGDLIPAVAIVALFIYMLGAK